MRAIAPTVSVAALLAIIAILSVTPAHAQEPPDSADETRTQLTTAGIPLLNSPPPVPSPSALPAQPGPEAPPQAIPVDLPIPDPTDWIPNPTDWIPGGLNPLNWAGDIVNAVFTIEIGRAHV